MAGPGHNVGAGQDAGLGGPRRVSPHTLTRIMTKPLRVGLHRRRRPRRGADSGRAPAPSGAEAISQAADMIRTGAADVVIAGGVDSCVNGLTISGFAQIRALSTRNEDPQAASRPFDRDRDGFVMAEGAGIMVLEREDHARARGAEILGVTRRQRRHLRRRGHRRRRPRRCSAACLQKAIAAAGLTGQDIGSSTPMQPPPRWATAWKRKPSSAVVGRPVPVTSTKALTGHLLGAPERSAPSSPLRHFCTGGLPGTRQS